MSEEKLDLEQFYGKSAQEWLDRWDAGETVWSIEMGGLGPGYEQCIHITAAEVLRKLLASNFDLDADTAKQDWKKLDNELMEHPVLRNLGLSGAQYGAARNLAAMIYRHGPVGVMQDERVKDRQIQVEKNFPRVGETA